MEQLQIEKLAKKLQISPVRVVQEAYEMVILKGLAENSVGRFLVFKGGTSLRLIYGAPRFSEDLDFSITKDFSEENFQEAVSKVAEGEPNLFLVEALKKHWTLFALFKIKEDFLPQALTIKLEISTRKKIKDFETRIASSEVTPLQVLLRVFSLEQLLEEKKKVLQERRESRDLFDVWYLAQKLKQKVDIPVVEIDRKVLKRELHKFLPKNYWSTIEELEQYVKDKRNAKS